MQIVGLDKRNKTKIVFLNSEASAKSEDDYRKILVVDYRRYKLQDLCLFASSSSISTRVINELKNTFVTKSMLEEKWNEGDDRFVMMGLKIAMAQYIAKDLVEVKDNRRISLSKSIDRLIKGCKNQITKPI